MQSEQFKAKVDDAAAPLMKSREEIMAQLRKEGAVGVVVAVRGEIVWADLFSSTDLLSRYWTKLVRSYAAESLDSRRNPSEADCGRRAALSRGPHGRHRNQRRISGRVPLSRTEVGRERRPSCSNPCCPMPKSDVHISKLKLRNVDRRMRPMGAIHGGPMPIRPPGIPPVPVE